MTIQLPLSDGSFVMIDDEDMWALDYRWAIRESNQLVFALKPHPPGGKILRRIIMGVEKGGYVSHINGDKRDFRRSNLTTVHPNAAPRPPELDERVRIYPTMEGEFSTAVLVNGSRVFVGTYASEDEAKKEAMNFLAIKQLAP